MRVFLLVIGLTPLVAGAGSPAVAAATDHDTAIHTTIVIRSKASECPPNFIVFQLDSREKMPIAPRICFVRSAAPKAKDAPKAR